MELSNEDLLLRLPNFEDFFVERKTASEKKDWLYTVVAFANSAPIDYPAVLFIGVKNDGTIENTGNLDKLQQTFTEILGQAYPPIATFSKVLEKDGKQCLAVIVPGSPIRPHFAGQSFVREGSETKKASDEQFTRLIAERNSKAREILKWKGKRINVRATEDRTVIAGLSFNRGGNQAFTLEDCNQFYVTISDGGRKDSFPLEQVEISFDHSSGTPRLEIGQ